LCDFIPEILTTITYRHPGKYKKKAMYIGFREMRYSPVVKEIISEAEVHAEILQTEYCVTEE
jgi:hypothetical protein